MATTSEIISQTGGVQILWSQLGLREPLAMRDVCVNKVSDQICGHQPIRGQYWEVQTNERTTLPSGGVPCWYRINKINILDSVFCQFSHLLRSANTESRTVNVILWRELNNSLLNLEAAHKCTYTVIVKNFWSQKTVGLFNLLAPVLYKNDGGYWILIVSIPSIITNYWH